MTNAPEPAPTSAELLKHVRESYAEYSDAVAAIPEETLTAPGTLDDWSVRDVIAHVGADQRWMAGQLEALLAGEQPTAMSCYSSDEPLPAGADLSTQDGRNAWQRERLRGLSLDDVRTMVAESHERLLAVIESFSDEQLAEELTIANLGTVGWVRRPEEGEQGWPLWQWLRGVTYYHYAEHTAALRVLKS
jgi:uncharacterized protein (TIGR03083 family)